jgi:uncharacterized protein YegL
MDFIISIADNDENAANSPFELPNNISYDTMNLIFLLDTSGSMAGQRINQLNTAMPIALDAAREAAMNKEVDLFVRIIQFGSQASWVMGDETKGVAINDACQNWQNLTANGSTDTAAAIKLALEAMRTSYMGTRNYHPVVILITDGDSNDHNATRAAIDELRMALSGGNPKKKDKVWRLAIGVEGYNEAELLDFAMHGTIEDEYGNSQENVPMIFKVENASALAKVLKMVTVSSLVSNTPAGEAGGNVGPVIDF